MAVRDILEYRLILDLISFIILPVLDDDFDFFSVETL